MILLLLQRLRRMLNITRNTLVLLLATLVAQSSGANGLEEIANCTSVADLWIDNPRSFNLQSWINRGICVRQRGSYERCYNAFQLIQSKNLDEVRKAEYAAATSVLVLLPTIGALLGAPTAEIWRLFTIIPFGGFLAMTMSFGGAIIPVRVKDYETNANGQRTTIGRSVVTTANALGNPESAEDDEFDYTGDVVQDIRRRLRQDESHRLAKGHLWLGLTAMFVFFCGAQAVMVVIEQGSMVLYICTSRYWMHIWYLIVTATAIFDSWAQTPFSENWKLLVSDVPYDVCIRNGDDILPKINSSTAQVRHIKHQFGSLRAGNVTLYGSAVKTKSRNSLLVMVSVVTHGQNQLRTLSRLFSKVVSIATFVTGTVLFASTLLLAAPVAVLVVTIILAVGILSRAITAWIVSGVSKTEPLLHVIVDSTEEAQNMVASILSVDADRDDEGGESDKMEHHRGIQVELNGHVFVNQKRVHTRTTLDKWWVQLLGILAEPFDLRRVAQVQPAREKSQFEGPGFNEVEIGLLNGHGS